MGEVLGGHAGCRCIVRTTAEVLLALLPEWSFGREPDAATGHAELIVAPKTRRVNRAADPTPCRLRKRAARS
jgi:hypothetical protein